MRVVAVDPSTASSSATVSTHSRGSNFVSCFMQDLGFSFLLSLLQRQSGRARLPNLTAALMGFSHPIPHSSCEIPLSAPYLVLCIMFTAPCCSLASQSQGSTLSLVVLKGCNLGWCAQRKHRKHIRLKKEIKKKSDNNTHPHYPDRNETQRTEGNEMERTEGAVTN